MLFFNKRLSSGAFLILLLFLILYGNNLFSQVQNPCNTTFSMVSDAREYELDSKYYLLCDGISNNQRGAIWGHQQLNLNNDFDISFNANFGFNEGADGIAFVLHTDSRGLTALGIGGGSIGYAHTYGNDYNPPIFPAFIVEFDTYFNDGTPYPTLGDDLPAPDNTNGEDHIAMAIHKSTWRQDIENSLVGTISNPLPDDNGIKIAKLGNIEDTKDHCIRITWNATTHVIQVYFDGSLKMTKTIDLIQEFSTNGYVYWGLTAATGGAHNDHKVSFDNMIITRPDVEICYGDQVELTTIPFVNCGFLESVTWSPTTGLNDATILSPVASPQSTTRYTVTMLSTNGGIVTDEVLVTVKGKPQNIILNSYGRYRDETKSIKTAEEINGLLKTAECGYLFSCQTTIDYLSDQEKIFHKSAHLIKTDCEGNLEWQKYYIRDPQLNGLHHCCSFNVCNVFEKLEPEKQINNYCGNEAIQTQFKVDQPIGYTLTGESCLRLPDQSFVNMYVLYVDLLGNVKGSVVFDSDRSFGEYVQPTSDGGVVALGIEWEEYPVKALVSKLKPTASSLEIDNTTITTGDANLYSCSQGHLRCVEIKETKDGYLLVGSFNQTTSSNTYVLVIKLRKTPGLDVEWGFYYNPTGIASPSFKGTSIYEDITTGKLYIAGIRNAPNGIILMSIDPNGLNPQAQSIYINGYDLNSDLKQEPTLIVNDNSIFISAWGENVNGNSDVFYIKTSKNLNDYSQTSVYKYGDGGGSNPGSDVTFNNQKLGYNGMASVIETQTYGDPLGDLLLVTSNEEQFICSNFEEFTQEHLTISPPANMSYDITKSHINKRSNTFQAYAAVVDKEQKCLPQYNCYCSDEYIHLKIETVEKITPDDENKCCYKLIFNSRQNACPVSQIKIIIDGQEQIWNKPLNSGTSYQTINLCLDQFTGSKSIEVRYIDGSNQTICSTTRDLICKCDCDDFRKKKYIKLEAKPIEENSETNDKCCYSLDLTLDLPCVFNGFDIEMEVSPELSLFIQEFTGSNGWYLVPPYLKTVGNKSISVFKFVYTGDKRLLKKGDEPITMEIGRFCLLKGPNVPSDKSVNLRLNFGSGDFDYCNTVWNFDLNCNGSCCDVIDISSTRNYHFEPSETGDCCYDVHFWLPENISGSPCEPVQLRITLPNGKKILFDPTEPSGHFKMGTDNNEENIIQFCIEDEDRSDIDPYNITIEFVNAAGKVVCKKTETIAIPECEDCCEKMIVSCSCNREEIGFGLYQTLYYFAIYFPPGMECDIYSVEVVYPSSPIQLPGGGEITLPDQVIGYSNRSNVFPYDLQRINFPISLGPLRIMPPQSSVVAYIKLYDKDGKVICEYVQPLYTCGFGRTPSDGKANDEQEINVESINNNLSELYCVPNPATENTDITFNLNEKTNIQIELSNIIGDKVSSVVMTGVKGINTYRLNTELIPAGVYYVKAISFGKVYTTTLIIVK